LLLSHPLLTTDILIIDRDELSRALLQTILMRVGHQVAVFSCAADAHRQIEIQRPALIIIDDSASAVALSRQLKHDVEWGAIPIVLSTAQLLNDGGAALRRESGADVVIMKPWRREELEAVMNALLS